MIKIVCLIKPIPSAIYLTNHINNQNEVELVIIEDPKIEEVTLGLLRRILTFVKSPQRIIKKIKKIINRKTLQKKEIAKTEINNYYFGKQWQFVNKSIPVMHVANINSPEVSERLSQLKPDLIIDHGTNIVKDHIINTAKLSLNLHTGLSPYYRGAYCTEWALINWDPYNIGVTIHKLSSEIDGGSILAQARATIKPKDTVHSINMQLGHLGVNLLSNAVVKLNNQVELTFYNQDFSLGYITYGRQWNEILVKQIEFIENNYQMAIMLKKPSRKANLKIFDDF